MSIFEVEFAAEDVVTAERERSRSLDEKIEAPPVCEIITEEK